jgi:hypothetical protein
MVGLGKYEKALSGWMVPGPRFETGTPEYEAGVLTMWLLHW